jgi:hypothetical protein
MIAKLHQLHITSDIAYLASVSSIVLSIGVWLLHRDEDAAHAERFGIFVGLWAPTFAILGNVLQAQERAAGVTS